MSTLDVKGIAARQRALLESDFLSGLGSKSEGPVNLKGLARLADEYGKYLVKKTPQVLKSLDLVASKNLSQSASFDYVQKNGEVISLRFYMADHWVNVHYGEKRSRAQGAKAPPLEAIMEWLAYKPIQIRSSNQQTGEEVILDNMAKAKKIQQAIWRRGYTVKRFGRNGSRFLDQVLDQQSLNDLAEMMGELGAVSASFDILSVVPINPKNGKPPGK